MSRRDRRRLRPDPVTGTPPDDGEDGEDDDDEDDSPEQLPDSSLPDLTTPADPQAFDQTFTDEDALLTLQGDFDPVAGPKQVLPRVAYTLNFNFVWNPNKQRWEPQKKSDLEDEDDDIIKIGAVGTLTGLLVGIDELESTVITDAVDVTETTTDATDDLESTVIADAVDVTETATDANLSSNVTVS